MSSVLLRKLYALILSISLDLTWVIADLTGASGNHMESLVLWLKTNRENTILFGSSWFLLQTKNLEKCKLFEVSLVTVHCVECFLWNLDLLSYRSLKKTQYHPSLNAIRAQSHAVSFLVPFHSDLKHNFSIPPPSAMAGATDSFHQGNIRITLEDPELWKSFHEIGTEMIITKPGR